MEKLLIYNFNEKIICKSELFFKIKKNIIIFLLSFLYINFNNKIQNKINELINSGKIKLTNVDDFIKLINQILFC